MNCISSAEMIDCCLWKPSSSWLNKPSNGFHTDKSWQRKRRAKIVRHRYTRPILFSHSFASNTKTSLLYNVRHTSMPRTNTITHFACPSHGSLQLFLINYSTIHAHLTLSTIEFEITSCFSRFMVFLYVKRICHQSFVALAFC